MGLLDAFKQYIADALPGGLLNPETKPVANQAKYIGGLLDPNSPISQDAQNWHKRTQIGLADQLAGRQTPEAEQAYQTMMQAAGIAPVGMIAWHGSPHKFDKFDLSKIGTGEGAQAYGHGLYLAESPEVAKTYGLAGSGLSDYQKVSYGGNTYESFDPMAALLYDITKKGRAPVVQNLQQQVDRHMATRPDYAKKLQEKIDFVKSVNPDNVKIEGGNLYKTDIPDEAVARFLDWDKPLSQQAPEVKKLLGFSDKTPDEIHSAAEAIFAEGNKRAGKAGGWMDYPDLKAKYDALNAEFDRIAPDITGEHFYRGTTPDNYLHSMLGGNQAFPSSSEDLLRKGIPGIRYLDGGSRGTGTGTSNFVAFDPEMIRILERNGQPTGLQPWKPGEWK